MSIPFEEAGEAYDYILVGGGGTAAAFIDAVIGIRPDARILVIEQGPYLLPSHVQNLGLAYQPLMASAAATPWRSDGDLEIVAQVPYLGGRTLMWSGSCPQPTTSQLRDWPVEVVAGLAPHWEAARRWLGVRSPTELGPEFGELHTRMRSAVAAVAASDPTLVTPDQDAALDAPLAYPRHMNGEVQKFAAIVPLLNAVVRHSNIHIVTDCEVASVQVADGMASEICTTLGTVGVGNARVILTSGTSEATGIVLRSKPGLSAPLAGANLAANSASFFTCRIPREAFSGLRKDLPNLAALYVDGATDEREFHLHVSAVASENQERDLERVFHLMPDMFGEGTPERACDPGHVVIVIHGLAEVASRQTERDGSAIRVDEALKTVGTFRLDQADRHAWDAMDAAAEVILTALAGDWPVEYWNPDTNGWQPSPTNRRMPFAFHETGTLWMGQAEDDSVSDVWGRLHETDNLFVLGGSTFPTRGSWNPFLMMVTLARRLAERLESKHAVLEDRHPIRTPTRSDAAPAGTTLENVN